MYTKQNGKVVNRKCKCISTLAQKETPVKTPAHNRISMLCSCSSSEEKENGQEDHPKVPCVIGWRWTIQNLAKERTRRRKAKKTSDSETNIEDAEPTSDRQLKNRSLLQKPKWFEDHIMEVESYLDDYNPETYEEAVNSKNSTN
ncbi:hypothetical protein TNIN_83241 [Trichonephila inaurata madagascariensis]|uniref:Uncharacterized protein n=1 Tax=Trichonephila inaurata madagascariensis TaxID=2747483 RepID=A0A8X6YS14_9ARAC|nr:hypothetical protein TNIN_83241 [Trichonephila inaurata madagascariensis]